MPKFKLMLARFPGNNSEHPDTTDWFVKTAMKAKADPRIGEVCNWRISDTPITMGRNRCLEVAKKAGVDYVVMVDSDMAPDMYVGHDPQAVPFWETAWDFMTRHDGPCMVGAPYCGPAPIENIYVFKWATRASNSPDHDCRLEQFTREEAADRHGIELVAALPTGLVIIDMRAVERLMPPYFYYEWTDRTESEKASTEDVTFTRDLALQGIPLYCLWDCWAGHWKPKRVGRPRLLRNSDVSDRFVQTVLRNQRPSLNEEPRHVQHFEPTDPGEEYASAGPRDGRPGGLFSRNGGPGSSLSSPSVSPTFSDYLGGEPYAASAD